MFMRRSDRVIICSYIKPSDKDNMLWHNSSHPFLRLAIHDRKILVSQHLIVCKRTCGTPAATYKGDSRIYSR